MSQRALGRVWPRDPVSAREEPDALEATRSSQPSTSFFSSLLCFYKWGDGIKNASVGDGFGEEEAHGQGGEIKISRVRSQENTDIDDENTTQSDSYNEDRSTYTDTDTSVHSGRSKGKKKKNRKRCSSHGAESVRSMESSSSSHSQPTSFCAVESVADEFVGIMQGGVRLLAATATGSARTVILVTDKKTMTWGTPKSKPVMSMPLSSISKVLEGMPPKVAAQFSPSDIDRSFHTVLRGESKAATFLAPTALERDALIRGFCALVEVENPKLQDRIEEGEVEGGREEEKMKEEERNKK